MNDTIPPEFWQGVEQFNSGQFYACHDTLEALWIEATEPERSFYQGILQIAVALYHLGNCNLRGAVILLGEGSNRLRRYSANYAGLDIAEFLDQSVTLLHKLQQIEPKDIASGDWKNQQSLPMIPKIVLLNK
jgi:predicted metal-dependent hydrolase